jgi:hypothetical protein
VLIIIFYAEDYVEAFGGAQAWNSKFPAQRFFLAKKIFGVETDCSLKRMNVVHPSSQSNVWEPGENPGRLRHCNGYKFPRATEANREGGKAV